MNKIGMTTVDAFVWLCLLTLWVEEVSDFH